MAMVSEDIMKRFTQPSPLTYISHVHYDVNLHHNYFTILMKLAVQGKRHTVGIGPTGLLLAQQGYYWPNMGNVDTTGPTFSIYPTGLLLSIGPTGLLLLAQQDYY